MAGQVDEDSYLKVRDENAQLKKLLHQSGKPGHCELVLSANRSATTHVLIWSAVLSRQGEKQKIMATKIMKMTVYAPSSTFSQV